MREATAEARAEAVKRAEDAASSPAMRRGAERTLAALRREEAHIGHTAAREVVDAPSADVGLWKSLAAGSKDDAHLINDTRGLLATYSEDAAVQRAGERLERLAVRGRAAFAPAAAVDLHDKAAVFSDRFTPHAGHLHGYNEWKERFVMSGGEVE